ncbi:hypothetical protein G6F66_014409 [Rhizopus arrhizus]|nr:hypothetical protein G6F66_014409 [Rhizopus arrhizus]
MHVECKEVVHHLGESGHAGSHEMGLVDGQADFQATHHRGELAAVHPGGHRRLLQLEDAVDLAGRHIAAGQVIQAQHLLQCRKPAGSERQLVQRQVRDQAPLCVAAVAESQRLGRLAQQADRLGRAAALDGQVASGHADRQLVGQVAIAAGRRS